VHALRYLTLTPFVEYLGAETMQHCAPFPHQCALYKSAAQWRTRNYLVTLITPSHKIKPSGKKVIGFWEPTQLDGQPLRGKHQLAR
jgi:hypothetical protein